MRRLPITLCLWLLAAAPGQASLLGPLDLEAGQRSLSVGPLTLLPDVRYDHALSDNLSVGVAGMAVFFGYGGFLLGGNATYRLGRGPGGLVYGASVLGGVHWLPFSSTVGFQATPAGAYPWAFPALTAAIPLGGADSPVTLRAAVGPMILVDQNGAATTLWLPLPEMGIRLTPTSELVLLGSLSPVSWRGRF